MQNNDDELIKKEIQENYDAILKLKKLIPLGVISMAVFSFVYPLIPGRKSREPLADWLGYPYAVLACLVLSSLVYLIGYKFAVKKRKRKIVQLERTISTDHKVLDNEAKNIEN